MADKESRPAYPYTSFRTILNLLQRFEGDKGVPVRLDRGVLTGSEGSKTQVLAGLKFLGLIGASGEALPILSELALKPLGRPAMVADLLRQHYATQVALGGKPSTQKQLEESFEGLDGDTRRKAVAFFLHAAKFAKLQVSPYFKTPRVSAAAAAAGRKRKGRTAGDNGENGRPTIAPPSSEEGFRQKYIDLLMKRVESGDQLDEKLLDRIEGLLGYRKP